jgi:hypothetical protein
MTSWFQRILPVWPFIHWKSELRESASVVCEFRASLFESLYSCIWNRNSFSIPFSTRFVYSVFRIRVRIVKTNCNKLVALYRYELFPDGLESCGRDVRITRPNSTKLVKGLACRHDDLFPHLIVRTVASSSKVLFSWTAEPLCRIVTVHSEERVLSWFE